jgi:hypothetical protein
MNAKLISLIDLRSYSVITGTPPSIREDATIRIAPEILKGVDLSTSILQILAEAELCLLWGKVSNAPQLNIMNSFDKCRLALKCLVSLNGGVLLDSHKWITPSKTFPTR